MDEETQSVAKLLQGWIAGSLMASRAEGTMPLLITKVDVPTDEDGNYADYIEVTLRSGRLVHILFTSFMPDLPELPF